jgi:hypothetical protein
MIILDFDRQIFFDYVAFLGWQLMISTGKKKPENIATNGFLPVKPWKKLCGKIFFGLLGCSRDRK